MSPVVFHLAAYTVSFGTLWFGAKLVTNSVTRLAKLWKLPLFTISFFVLGLLTSLPELSIGVSAVVNDDPVIYAGNLLGGVIVIFLLVIPLLGLLGDGLKIPRHLHQNQIILMLIIALVPSLLTADQKVNVWEGVVMVLTYFTLFLFLPREKTLLEKFTSSFMKYKVDIFTTFIKIGVGVVFLVLASSQVVQSTLFFGKFFTISPFFISLLVVSVGTNIPELAIIIRSLLEKKSELALADYLGSASANTLLFGLMTILYGKTVFLPNHFLQRFIFLTLGLVTFYIFARSKSTLSRKESAVLLLCYFALILFEATLLIE